MLRHTLLLLAKPRPLAPRAISLAFLVLAAIFANPAAHAQTHTTFRSLHCFRGRADGTGPLAPLIRDAAGNFYGTTYTGGAFGVGTVFKVDPFGKESLIYSFAGTQDGANPEGGLIADADGN